MFARVKPAIKNAWRATVSQCTNWRRMVYHTPAEKAFKSAIDRIPQRQPGQEEATQNDDAILGSLRENPSLWGVCDRNWNNVFHKAIQANQPILVQKLCELLLEQNEQNRLRAPGLLEEAKVYINAKNWASETPLGIAARAGLDGIVDTLLEHDAAVGVESKGSTPLHHATGNGHSTIVEKILLKGHAVNQQMKDKMRPYSREDALWIDRADSKGRTALQIAIEQNAITQNNPDQKDKSLAVVGYLLIMGADPNAFTTQFPYTAFDCARELREEKRKGLLLQRLHAHRIEEKPVTFERRIQKTVETMWSETAHLQNTRTYRFLTVLFYLIIPTLTMSLLLGPIAGILTGIVEFIKYGSPEMLLWGGNTFYEKIHGLLKPHVHRRPMSWVAKAFDWLAIAAGWAFWALLRAVWLWDVVSNPIKRLCGFCLGFVCERLAGRFTNNNEELRAAAYFFGREFAFRLSDLAQRTSAKKHDRETFLLQLEATERYSKEIWKSLGWGGAAHYLEWKAALEKSLERVGEQLGLIRFFEYNLLLQEWIDRQTPERIKEYQNWMHETERRALEKVETALLGLLSKNHPYRVLRETTFRERRELIGERALAKEQQALEEAKKQLNEAVNRYREVQKQAISAQETKASSIDNNIKDIERARDLAYEELRQAVGNHPAFQFTIQQLKEKHRFDPGVWDAMEQYIGKGFISKIRNAEVALDKAHADKEQVLKEIQGLSQNLSQPMEQLYGQKDIKPLWEALQSTQVYYQRREAEYQAQLGKRRKLPRDYFFGGAFQEGVNITLAAMGEPKSNNLYILQQDPASLFRQEDVEVAGRIESKSVAKTPKSANGEKNGLSKRLFANESEYDPDRMESAFYANASVSSFSSPGQLVTFGYASEVPIGVLPTPQPGVSSQRKNSPILGRKEFGNHLTAGTSPNGKRLIWDAVATTPFRSGGISSPSTPTSVLNQADTAAQEEAIVWNYNSATGEGQPISTHELLEALRSGTLHDDDQGNRWEILVEAKTAAAVAPIVEALIAAEDDSSINPGNNLRFYFTDGSISSEHCPDRALIEGEYNYLNPIGPKRAKVYRLNPETREAITIVKTPEFLEALRSGTLHDDGQGNRWEVLVEAKTAASVAPIAEALIAAEDDSSINPGNNLHFEFTEDSVPAEDCPDRALIEGEYNYLNPIGPKRAKVYRLNPETREAITIVKTPEFLEALRSGTLHDDDQGNRWEILVEAKTAAAVAPIVEALIAAEDDSSINPGNNLYFEFTEDSVPAEDCPDRALIEGEYNYLNPIGPQRATEHRVNPQAEELSGAGVAVDEGEARTAAPTDTSIAPIVAADMTTFSPVLSSSASSSTAVESEVIIPSSPSIAPIGGSVNMTSSKSLLFSPASSRASLLAIVGSSSSSEPVSVSKRAASPAPEEAKVCYDADPQTGELSVEVKFQEFLDHLRAGTCRGDGDQPKEISIEVYTPTAITSIVDTLIKAEEDRSIDQGNCFHIKFATTTNSTLGDCFDAELIKGVYKYTDPIGPKRAVVHCTNSRGIRSKVDFLQFLADLRNRAFQGERAGERVEIEAKSAMPIARIMEALIVGEKASQDNKEGGGNHLHISFTKESISVEKCPNRAQVEGEHNYLEPKKSLRP